MKNGSSILEKKFCPKSFQVLERDSGEGYQFVTKDLEKLYCNNTFEGENFKIVYATDESPIAFDNKNIELVKKAANVYYHLTLARNFWINNIKSEYVQNLPQITVRLWSAVVS